MLSRDVATGKYLHRGQTPIIYPYFYNYLTATSTSVKGVQPTAIGHLFLFNASKA